MLVAATLQALLVFRSVGFEDTIAYVLAAGGAVGLWLLVANWLLLTSAGTPGGLPIAGIAADAGYILGAVGFRIGGQDHPLSWLGAGLAMVGYSVWAVWLGWSLQAGALVVPG